MPPSLWRTMRGFWTGLTRGNPSSWPIHGPYLADLIVTVLEGTPFPDLPRALPLLLGTCAQESHLRYLRQLGGGPACGLGQMEPATAKDHWRWLAAQPLFLEAVQSRTGLSAYTKEDLTTNFPLQILLVRTHYYVRDPARLPEAVDIIEQSERWKQYYNTAAGAGTATDYLNAWEHLIAPWYAPRMFP